MRLRVLLVLAALGLLALHAWWPAPERPAPPDLARRPARLVAPNSKTPAPTSDVRGPTTHALLISGGGSPELNFQSHLLHVRELVRLLSQAGIPAERVTALVADGDDPGHDLALRLPQPEPDFWLVEPTALGPLLRTPVVLGNSTVTGARLFPATRGALGIWFMTARERLAPGDTLLLYVTDHGTEGKSRADDNRITLWGKDESLSVRELGALLDDLDPGVRVVMLMSQCYSGGFASLSRPRPAGDRGGVCGYFSSTADRPAYGCYPENRGKENVGHSFLFLRALERSQGSFLAAHDETLAADGTPDVPLRGSDLFLEGLLAQVAREQRKPLATLVDELLREQRPPDLQAAAARVGRIARGFGLPEPRSLGDLGATHERLTETRSRLAGHQKDLQASLRELSAANLSRFVHAHPGWAQPLADWVSPPGPDGIPAMATLKQGARDHHRLSQEQQRTLAASLLPELRLYTTVENPAGRLHLAVREKHGTLGSLLYRLEVREAVALRLRTALVSLASRVHLGLRGAKRDRADLASLDRCEDLTLPLESTTAAERGREANPASLPDELQLGTALLPATLGIQYRQASPEERLAVDGPLGTALLTAVSTNGPAERAGLARGDLLVAGSGRPLTEVGSLRAWALTWVAGSPERLQFVRNGERFELTIVPDAAAAMIDPEPAPNTSAPALSLQAYRGSLPATLIDGQKRILFFWASWCGPCKEALPDLMAFSSESGTPILAITKEPPEVLDKFFTGFSRPFPATIGIDVDSTLSRRYKVSGLPTFVVLDGNGAVVTRRVGFGRKGLRLADGPGL